jgi:phosphoserine phosphatase
MRAACFDIDGTLTSDNVWKGLMQYFQQRGERRGTHALFMAVHYPFALLRQARLVPEATFRRRWAAGLGWYFRGDTLDQMRALAEWVAHEFVAPNARADTLARLRDHLGQGDVVVLVSAAPQPLVEAVARMWAVPHAIGSAFAQRAGRYTGGLADVPCVDEQKARYTQAYFQRLNHEIDWAASYAYADSYADLGLFEMVGHPVVVYPERKLAALAQQRGWAMLGEAKA